MHASSTPGATTPSESHRPRRWRWAARAVRPIAIAAVVTAAIALTGTINRPAVTLMWADGIDLAPGVSVTPAPGWIVSSQGPGWAALHSPLGTAEIEIKVKPAVGTDPAAILQNDISQLSNISTTGLTNVGNVSAPTVTATRGGNFNQEASVNYTADGTSRMGAIPVVGWFVELLNTSTHQSAFVVFAQNGDAPVRVDNDATAIVDSLI